MQFIVESTLLPPKVTQKTVVSLALIHVSYRHFIQEVLEAAHQHRSGYACFANAHMVVEGVRDPSFARMVNAATWVTADGAPLAWHSDYYTGFDRNE